MLGDMPVLWDVFQQRLREVLDLVGLVAERSGSNLEDLGEFSEDDDQIAANGPALHPSAEDLGSRRVGVQRLPHRRVGTSRNFVDRLLTANENIRRNDENHPLWLGQVIAGTKRSQESRPGVDAFTRASEARRVAEAQGDLLRIAGSTQ